MIVALWDFFGSRLHCLCVVMDERGAGRDSAFHVEDVSLKEQKRKTKKKRKTNGSGILKGCFLDFNKAF